MPFQIENAVLSDGNVSLFAVGSELVRCEQIADTNRSLGRNDVSYCMWSCDLIVVH